MNEYKNYEFAKLDENQIMMINDTQKAIAQNPDEEIILVAYKKTK